MQTILYMFFDQIIISVCNFIITSSYYLKFSTIRKILIYSILHAKIQLKSILCFHSFYKSSHLNVLVKILNFNVLLHCLFEFIIFYFDTITNFFSV